MRLTSISDPETKKQLIQKAVDKKWTVADLRSEIAKEKEKARKGKDPGSCQKPEAVMGSENGPVKRSASALDARTIVFIAGQRRRLTAETSPSREMDATYHQAKDCR